MQAADQPQAFFGILLTHTKGIGYVSCRIAKCTLGIMHKTKILNDLVSEQVYTFCKIPRCARKG